jgi:hypothetical protein
MMIRGGGNPHPAMAAMPLTHVSLIGAMGEWGRVKSLIFFEAALSFRQNVGTDYCRFERRF